MSFEWDGAPPERVFGDMAESYAAALHRAVVLVMQQRKPEIENWMKANALWTDRTGNARQTLNTQVIEDLTEVVMELAHGMEYGFWLEVANAGRFAILTPAIDYWTPILLADVQALIG